MIVLVGCEYSARVRDSFRVLGHEAWSCDLLPCEGDPRWHLQCDLFEAIRLLKPELGIFHPPCTDLSVSGQRWQTDHWVLSEANGTHWIERDGAQVRAYWHDGKEKRAAQAAALAFVKRITEANVPKWAIENPVSRLSTLWRKPDQIISPWWFGHPEEKKTCLWLSHLPKLVPTHDVSAYMMTLPVHERHRVHHMSPGKDRWKDRSRTYSGIAAAMAMQWGA